MTNNNNDNIDNNKTFDIAIIGSGPGGYVAAIRAAQLGQKVAIIERDTLGGICLNWGCIPTKALLKCAEVYHTIKNANFFGISGVICNDKNITPDLKVMVKKSRDVAKQLTSGIVGLMKKNKIEVIYGDAKLINNSTIQVSKSENKNSKVCKITAKNIILATGARVKELSNLKIDHKNILDYKDAMSLERLPKSILVIGSGAIGMEFASFYNTLGVNVTVVEIASRILINEDEEIATIAHKSFVNQGMTILTSTKFNVIKISDNKHVEVELINDNGEKTKQTYEKIISAIGVVPNTENLGLENTKVQLNDRGFIEINEFMATNDANIYAIGDVTTAPLLAHKASHQGVLCVENIMKIPSVHGIDPKDVPSCTYTYPQIASVGYTEQELRKKGIALKVGRFTGIGNGKAIAIGESDYSMVKTIFDAKTGELLGVHMIGAEVTEMIYGVVMARNMEGTEEDIIKSIFPHPTLSEMIHESTLNAYNRTIHS